MVRPTPSAALWALFWLCGTALAVWVPLLLLQHVTTAPRAARRTPAPRNPPTTRRPPMPLAGRAAARTPQASAPAPLPTAFVAPAYPFYPTPAYPRLARASTPFIPGAFPPAVQSDTIEPGELIFPSRVRSGTALLGGPLGLESIGEKEMVPAARTELALRALAADPLQVFPRHWRNELRGLVRTALRVLPGEMVRIPAPHRRTPEEIPLAVSARGRAETTVAPSSPTSFQKLEGWAQRQSALPSGTVRPVVVVLEPIELRQQPSGLLPSTTIPRPAASQAPVDASQAPASGLKVVENAAIPVPIHSEDPHPPAAAPNPPPPPLVVTPPPASASAAIPLPIRSEDILP